MKTLEVPFYYFCDASFESLPPYCQDILKNSYVKYIKQRVSNNKPIEILAHPHIIGKVAKSFFAPIFKEIKQFKIPNYTLEQFARWWKQREKIKISYRMRGDQLAIKTNQYPVLIEIINNKKKLITTINKKITINLKKI